ncbi:alanine--tRNA ligase [Quadrisphaera sp. DSM 44207]|uniref:alanine--tRNA ligase n=1 Tax=Quadrisphaera sp. DSM 44207 TaxID=1881057 RepID=UPI0008924CE1|nr:alanine--tRNA ligase [Quadrisphaera sp. DSM 44207]SDQ47037.1 alanyl-tRNA synthetase [Quadrisphaera sp. DSM 44207]
METAEIRRRWLRYFEQQGHTVVPSASLVSPDPALLFTVAGMVPFIPYLTGQQIPPYPRATSVQKCVRTLDIDEVGKTTRHGTFFQMNGNFSFGDYFKEGAIGYAWELVTGSQDDGGYGFDPDTIWVTVYEDDDEAEQLWRKVAGLPGERIQRRGRKDNYWHTGAAGPGGPCSEIYVDRGPQHGREGGPVVDEDRYLEIWNLVFMQYQLADVRSKEDFAIVSELPAKNIDTGMGLERVAYLLQGVDNLYEIDEVAPVLRRAAELAGARYGADPAADVRLRVVADHVRAGLMLVGDGVTPTNEGGGYVLRRLLRRAVRAMRLLGVGEPVLPELLTVSRDVMSRSYPELLTDWERIASVVAAEEEVFLRTLSAGTTILDVAVREAKEERAQHPRLSGERAFQLHDTYGFPIDLTLEMAAEQGVEVDADGFRELMRAQKERARADAVAKRGGRADTSAYRDLLTEHGLTEWLAHTTLSTESTVLGVLDGGAPVPAAGAGRVVEVVLDRTPFYAESGGQDADAGAITWDGGRAEVLDVQRPLKGLVVHQARVLEGELATGERVLAQVDPDWRRDARQAHSGTHVVHAALREVLGPQALQSGSFNRPGYLRLDFSWKGALAPQQRSDVEDVANRAVRDDLPVDVREMPLEQARAEGALALFGETYGERVRVVDIGGPWSRELCGGTHVSSSAQIGPLVVTGESSVGASARRIEAAVGMDGFRYLARERDLVQQVSGLLKVQRDDVVDRVGQLLAQLREADRELAALRTAQVLARAASLAASAEDVGGVALVAADAGPVASADDLRALALDVRGRLGDSRPAAVALVGVARERPVVVVATTAAGRGAGVRAGALVRAAAQALGGGGGGKDDVAQGGGSDATALPAALQAVRAAVAATTGS